VVPVEPSAAVVEPSLPVVEAASVVVKLSMAVVVELDEPSSALVELSVLVAVV
jgi:hypothetical protein